MENEKPRVYLETSIFRHLVDDRAEIEHQIKVTAQWWEYHKNKYSIFISEAVIDELSRRSFPRQEEALSYARLFTELKSNQAIKAIVGVYVAETLMPRDVLGDALHLALASFYKMEYLLSWNCKNLANINKKRHIEVINRRLNLPVPQIITPDLLF